MKPRYLLAGGSLLFVLSCQSNNEVAELRTETSADTTSIYNLTGDSVKLIKKAGITVKVKNVQETARSVTKLTREFGGMITFQQIKSSEEKTKELKVSDDSVMVITAYSTQAEITARVPEAELGDFLFSVADLGYFVPDSELEVDDKSLDYLALQLKQQNRNRILSFGGKTKMTAREQVLSTDEAIDQNMGSRQINADARYSTVRLNLFQNAMVRREVVADISLDAYQLPFGRRIQDAFASGWTGALSFLLLLAHLWVFLLLAVSLWLIYKYQLLKRLGWK